jgi:hypothetical protein
VKRATDCVASKQGVGDFSRPLRGLRRELLC